MPALDYFKSPFRGIKLVAALLLLFSLSIDNVLALRVGNYDFRLSYVGVLILGLVAAARTLGQDSKTRDDLKRYLRQPSTRFFLGFSAVGVVALSNSHYLERSILFFIWTTGTLLAVPFLVSDVLRTFGRRALTALAVYLALQSVVIVFDYFASHLISSNLHLGRVHVSQPGHYRPHAWYQEPNYFAAFALLNCVWIRTWIHLNSGNSALFRVVYTLAMAALILSTSKLGFAGVALYSAFEIYRWLNKRAGVLRTKFFALIAILTVTLVGLMIWRDNPESLKQRLPNAFASLDVFREHPWIGVGAGAARAFLVDHNPDHPYIVDNGFITQEEKQQFRKDPLSFSIYFEVLSEWGIFGFIFLGCAIFFLVQGFPFPFSLLFWLILGLVGVSWQTLPRMDLWVTLSVIGCLPRLKEKDALKI